MVVKPFQAFHLFHEIDLIRILNQNYTNNFLKFFIVYHGIFVVEKWSMALFDGVLGTKNIFCIDLIDQYCSLKEILKTKIRDFPLVLNIFVQNFLIGMGMAFIQGDVY